MVARKPSDRSARPANETRVPDSAWRSTAMNSRTVATGWPNGPLRMGSMCRWYGSKRINGT